MTYSFSNDPLFVREGDVIQFQYTAPDSWDTTETVTIQIGLLTQFWFITTIPEDFEPDPFPFQAINNAELDTVYTYGDGTRAGEQIVTVSGLTPGTLALINLTANDFPDINRYSISINGGPFTLAPSQSTVQNGDTIQLRARTFNDPAQQLRVTLDIGLGRETWSLTTKQTPINSPSPAPQFINLTDLPLNSVVYSNVVIVQGLTGPGVVSAGAGAFVAVSNSSTTFTNADGYEVLTGATFAASANITNGQYLQLRATTSLNQFSTTSISVDIAEGIGVSTWSISTGQSLSKTPNSFSFPNVTNVAPGIQVPSAARPIGGISGLGGGITVPVELISTTGTTPLVKINSGSIGVFPAQVTNGDTITLYNVSSTTFGGNVETLIKVGERVIPTWSIDTYLTPDSIPSFTQPPNLVNRVPNTFITSAIIGLTDFNVPITITATNGALISIDYDTPVAGPRTYDPISNQLIYIVLQSSASLNATVSTVVTIGNATPFTWSITTYAVAPPPPSNLSTWYSIKTRKYDGLSIGTVVQVLKENVIDNYGDLEDRFPGFLECDGTAYPAAQYSELYNIIGNSYGGNASYNSTTKTYSGSFNVPDYRNRRLCGVGIVDGNKGGSTFLPVSSGTINLPGSEGGYWYIDRVDVSGTFPFEQVFGGTNDTTGTTSPFFELGTVKTLGTETLSADVRFNVNGLVTANINGINEASVRAPSHSHDFYTAQIEAESGEPVIPWGVRAFYGTDNQGQFGPFKPGGRDSFAKAVTQTNVAFTSLFATIPLFAGELARDGSGVTTDSLIPAPRGTTQFIGGNFWASPLSGLDAAGNRLTTLTGVANDAGVIDTNRGSSNVTSYISPGTTKTHSHLITLAAITNPQTDFTYGNVNGAGIKYAGSLPTSETAISVQFNQSEVLLELNDGAFTFNSSIKPIPSVALQPTKSVPIITPFHKVKYIIKAY